MQAYVLDLTSSRGDSTSLLGVNVILASSTGCSSLVFTCELMVMIHFTIPCFSSRMGETSGVKEAAERESRHICLAEATVAFPADGRGKAKGSLVEELPGGYGGENEG